MFWARRIDIIIRDVAERNENNNKKKNNLDQFDISSYEI